jgi:hypothetical protein
MRIEWATVCRYAESTASGTTLVGIAQTIVAPSELPWNFYLFVAVCITDLNDLPAIDSISGRVRDPNGDTVFEKTWSFAMEMMEGSDNLPAGFEPKQGSILEMPVEVTLAGRYQIEVQMSGNNEPLELGLLVAPTN